MFGTPGVRADDSDTSLDADRSVDRKRRQAEVMRSMHRIGEGTASDVTLDLWTAEGIASADNRVAKRLGELEAAGLVVRTDRRKPGPSGRPQTVWEIAP
jgi:predicted ArsR family transcriptional regulator